MDNKNEMELRALEEMETKAGLQYQESLGKAEGGKAEGKTDKTDAETEIQTGPETKPNAMDGYSKVDKSLMPHEAQLYPASWEFAYRCPTAKEVAAFSTVMDTDQPAVISVIEDLIRRCVMIFDTNRNVTIPTGNLNDSDRIFFLFLLRDYYLPSQPVLLKNICQTCKEQFDARLNAYALDYVELKQKLIDAFDGRRFTLQMPSGNEIRFHIPTLDTSSKVFKHLIKTYRNQQNPKDNQRETDKIIYDKTFLLFAPYLFETGVESIRDITLKYNLIKKNDSLFKDYLSLATKLKLDNIESFESECTHCGSLEETQVTFPGGIKNLFISDSNTESYF